MNKRIIVGIDFSEDSLNALEHAVFTSDKLNMPITMVWVDHVDYSKEIFNIDPDHRLNAVTHKFNELIKKYEKHCPGIDFVIRRGKVYKELCKTADELNAFLVVIGTHGLSGFEEFWSGSNANRIVSACNTPVVSIRKTAKVYDKMDIIVMPIDSSQYTRDKIPLTSKIAGYFDSEVHILGLLTSKYNDLRIKVRDFVLQAEDYLKEENIRYKTKIIESKNIADDTITYAVSVNASLISIMTEQELSTSNLWMGPYASQIVNHSPIPVLSIKPRK